MCALYIMAPTRAEQVAESLQLRQQLRDAAVINLTAYNKLGARINKPRSHLKALIRNLKQIKNTWTLKPAPLPSHHTKVWRRSFTMLGYHGVLHPPPAAHIETYTYHTTNQYVDGTGTFFIYERINNNDLVRAFTFISRNLESKLTFPTSLNVAFTLGTRGGGDMTPIGEYGVNISDWYQTPDALPHNPHYTQQTIDAISNNGVFVNTVNHNIQNKDELLEFWVNLANNRLSLKEVYDAEGSPSDYYDIQKLRIVSYPTGVYVNEPVGDKHTMLFTDTLFHNPGPRGYCVQRCIRWKLCPKLSIQRIQSRLGKFIPEFSNQDWDLLADKFNVNVILFDCKLNLRAVHYGSDCNKWLNLCIYNGHAYPFKCDSVPANIYKQHMRLMHLLGTDSETCAQDLLQLYLSKMPDVRAALEFISLESTKCLYLYNERTHTFFQYGDSSDSRLYITRTKKNLFIQKTAQRFDKLLEREVKLEKKSIAAPTRMDAPFDMTRVFVFDLETASCKDNIFHTYAAGWKCGDSPVQLRCVSNIATERHTLVYQMIEQMISAAKQHSKHKDKKEGLLELIQFTYQKPFQVGDNYFYHKKSKVVFCLDNTKFAKSWKVIRLPETDWDLPKQFRNIVKEQQGHTWEKQYYARGHIERQLGIYTKGTTSSIPTHFVYSFNGSRFDNLEVLVALLQNKDSREYEITDIRRSSGKIISFKYGCLCFLDICLLLMSSLKKACKTYDIPTVKGYLPHGYLQHCESFTEIQNRINSVVPLRELHDYIDWLDDMDCKPTEYEQKRYLNPDGTEKCMKEFILAHSNTKRWYDEHKDEMYSFKDRMMEYLHKDVQSLYELVEKFGTAVYDTRQINITKTPTIGALAMKQLRCTLKKSIPKILNTNSFCNQQIPNRGGYCGPVECMFLQKEYPQPLDEWWLWKVDITSLYPSATRTNEMYSKYFMDFPYPINGWIKKDYAGIPMTNKIRDELKKMYGIFEIEYNQADMIYSPVLQNVHCGQAHSLTRLETGRSMFTIPDILYYYDKGVQIKLYHGEYCTTSFNPFTIYMQYFEKEKNEADRLQKLTTNQKDWAKYEFKRTFAKLMLNSLIGKFNQHPNRTQTLLTESYNDVITILGNPFIESGLVSVMDLDNAHYYVMTYLEHDLEYQLGQMNIAPYLSGYVMSYSKILMAESFSYIKELGATICYTDTDSILFYASESMYKKYNKRFGCTNKYAQGAVESKQFGYMEIEGRYDYYISAGPKKYMVAELNCDVPYCEYKANGIKSRENILQSLKDRFEKLIFDNKAIRLKHFCIHTKESGISKLVHSYEEFREIQPVFYKGRKVGTDVYMWKDEAEFQECVKITQKRKRNDGVVELTAVSWDE